ncbi:hypothetical protein EDB83DRAFT_2322876 [Lactarius deliciosus]|nr:hypothetical protein EDB83DRAFT_2322876 [Lactarius deliciosus]
MGSAWGNMMCKNLTFSTISWMANLETPANSGDLKMAAMSSAPCKARTRMHAHGDQDRVVAVVVVTTFESRSSSQVMPWSVVGGVCDSELPAAAVLVLIAVVIVVVADSSEELKTLTYFGYIGGVPLDVVAVFELQSSPICCGPALVVISVVAAFCCGSPEENEDEVSSEGLEKNNAALSRLGHIDVTAAAKKDQRGLVKNDDRQFPPVP